MNKNKGKDLVAEELAASLSRQLSEGESELPELDLLDDDLEDTIVIDLSEPFDADEKEIDDPDDLLRELQAAVEEEFAQDSKKLSEEEKHLDFDEMEHFPNLDDLSEEDFEEVEEPAEEVVEESAEAAAEVAEEVEETVEETAEEAVEAETVEEVVEETIEQAVEAETVEEVVEETIEEAVEAETVEEVVEETIEETVEAETVEEVVEETIEEAVEAEAVEEAVEAEAVEEAVEAVEESIDEIVEEVAEETVEESVEAVAEVSVADTAGVAAAVVPEVAVTEEAGNDDDDLLESEDAETEEAFDEPDKGIEDVSRGVSAVTDAVTEEIPAIPTANLSRRAQKKAEKKRLKQEAAEARAREKQYEEEDRAREKQAAKEQKRLEKEERKANKKKGKGKVFFFVLLLFVAACAVVYLGLANRYKTVFFDGTKINGADCTGLTVEETETVITRQMDVYDLKLIFRDGKEEEVSGESIGFEYIPDGSVQEIKESQIPVMWATAFFEEYSYEATAACTYDEAKLTGTITALEECNIVNMIAPKDAYLIFNEEKKQFEIVPEERGNKFELSALILAIQDAVLNGVREINAEELGIYEQPAVTSDNAELIAKRDELNDVISPVITYTLPNGTDKVLDATTMVTWLEHDDNGNYSFNPELWGNNVANFVEDLAGEVNTSDTTAEFTTRNGAKVSLDNYLQGWLINEEEEAQKLTENLSARENVTREPIYSQRAFSDENNGIGNTYVEVDLTSQYLWAVENGQVVIETPIVSGMMVASRYTPEGIYPLYGKQRGRTLRGTQAADGSYEYESWVDYWMPFNGGIGLHDASWRAEFGENIYVGGGSHGCVNMPTDKAAAVFDWIENGTPIICYYTGGINLAPEGTYGE